MMLKRDSDNQLWCEKISIEECARQFGTPLYVYSETQIRENVKQLQKAISRYFHKWRISYAVKANSNPHLLRIFLDENIGVDCSSPAEVYIALKTGFPKNKCTYTGNYESMEDLKFIAENGILINLDDYNRLDDLLQFTRPEVVSFRINPGSGRGGFEGIVTGGTGAKFGIPYEKIRETYESAIKAGFQRFGIHMMTGSNILEPMYFAEITAKLLTLAGEALKGLGIVLDFVDIGGGFGIPYTEGEHALNMDSTFKHVASEYYDHCRKYNLGEPELIVEPGRFLIGNAGILLSRVTHIKDSYRLYMGIDCGMNTLLRPALYGAFHRIWIDRKPVAGDNPYIITGQICENSDMHPGERKLPEANPGDLAVVLDTGAYGYSMSSNYNNRPRPPEVLIHGSSIKIIRRAETFEDIFNEVIE